MLQATKQLCFLTIMTVSYAQLTRQLPANWRPYVESIQANAANPNSIVYPQIAASNVVGRTAPKPLLNTAATNNTLEVSKGAQQFSIDLFTETLLAIHSSGERRDFMIAPFSIWALLLLLLEGASGNTEKQLRDAMHINVDQQTIRQAFRETASYLRINNSNVEVAILQSMYSDKNQPLLPDYERKIELNYRVKLGPVDFNDVNKTYNEINADVKQATRGLIQYAIQPQDLRDARLILLSSLYFKGRWRYPFNKTMTVEEAFYDDNGNYIGNVQMMYQEEHFNYDTINELQAHVIELPYGDQNRLSMIIILPKKGVPLDKVATNLRKFGVPALFERLLNAEIGYEDDTVELLLPRFTTSTDLHLEYILKKLNITDILGSTADLSKMSSRELFVSKILQGTKITVDEEGTEAAALTSATLIYKMRPPQIKLNRPFIYLIVEKSVNLLVFAGQVVNPTKFNY